MLIRLENKNLKTIRIKKLEIDFATTTIKNLEKRKKILLIF